MENLTLFIESLILLKVFGGRGVKVIQCGRVCILSYHHCHQGIGGPIKKYMSILSMTK